MATVSDSFSRRARRSVSLPTCLTGHQVPNTAVSSLPPVRPCPRTRQKPSRPNIQGFGRPRSRRLNHSLAHTSALTIWPGPSLFCSYLKLLVKGASLVLKAIPRNHDLRTPYLCNHLFAVRAAVILPPPCSPWYMYGDRNLPDHR